MPKRRELTTRAEFWRAVLARQDGSELSVRGFCQRESLSEPSFYWWRRKLAQDKQAGRRRGRSESASREGSGKKRAASAHFVNVSLLTDAAMIELELAGGRRLRIPPGCDEETLATVLRVLESPSC